MSKAILIVALTLLANLSAAFNATAAEGEAKMKRQGDMYIIELSGMYNYYAVLDMLQIQLFDRGWQVRNVHDVDLRLRKLGHLVHDKVINASKPDYVSEAAEVSLRSALVLPTDIVVYESYKDVENPWSYRTRPGTIEIAFIDPAAKAAAVGLEGLPNLDKATAELRAAVESTVAFFIETATAEPK